MKNTIMINRFDKKQVVMVSTVIVFTVLVSIIYFENHSVQAQQVTQQTTINEPPGMGTPPPAVFGIEQKYIPTASNSTTAPVVNLVITHPASGQVFASNTAVVHKASASDTLKNDVSSKIEWRDASNILLGQGSQLSMLRPAGSYTVTANVLGADGKRSSSQIFYVVSPNNNSAGLSQHKASSLDTSTNTHTNANENTLSKPTAFTAQPDDSTPAKTADYLRSVYFGVNQNVIPSPQATDVKGTNILSEGVNNQKLTNNSNIAPTQPTTTSPPKAYPVTHKIPDNELTSSIDMKKWVTSTDSNIDWESLEINWDKDQFGGKTIQKSTDPSVLELDYSNEFGGTDTLRYSVRNTEGQPSEFATLTITTGIKPPIELEGFEVPAIPLDKPLENSWQKGFLYTPVESEWKFSGSTGVGIQRNGSYNTNDGNDSLLDAPRAPEGVQTAFLMGNNAHISKEIFLNKGSYSISFLAAQRRYGIETKFPVQVNIDGRMVGNTILPIGMEFKKYTSDEFVAHVSKNYIFELNSTKVGYYIPKEEPTLFIDKIQINHRPNK
jgi:hypothetical protein